MDLLKHQKESHFKLDFVCYHVLLRIAAVPMTAKIFDIASYHVTATILVLPKFVEILGLKNKKTQFIFLSSF
jgi:hypothetical protein